MDKIRINKKLKYCMSIVSIIGIISGILFFTILKDADKETVYNSLETFLTNVNNNSLNYSLGLRSNLIVNLMYIILIWLLGISIIGIPIIIFLYFTKVFVLGFTISSFTVKYGIKGILYGLIYIFPHNILNIVIMAILSIYSIIYSFRLSDSFFKKDTIDFKPIINTHKYILLISIIGILLTSLYGTYIMPWSFKTVLNLLK